MNGMNPVQNTLFPACAEPVEARSLRSRCQGASTSSAHAGLLVLTSLALAACSVGPNYSRPAVAPIPITWKTEPGWQAGTPGDQSPRGDWWAIFGDPALDALEAQVAAANQNVAASVAAVEQAQALVREDRAAFFPTVGVTGGVTRSGGGGSGSVSTGGTTVVSSGSGARTRVALGATASWQPDLFGRVRRTVEGARADADAARADLGNVTLLAQSELATDYFALRALDAQKLLLDDTTAGYQKSLTITQNRYNAGVSARADLVQAHAQLFGAQAAAVDLGRQRAVYENAIAVLVGQNPSGFRLASGKWVTTIPQAPRALPSTLTERRPDIAAAERRVAAANAQIGVQTSAFFPALTLSASGTTSGSALGDLFAASSNFWSFGAQIAQTLLDFGARKARVEQARAAWRQAVAQYRQTVLTAFGEVENQLAAADVLTAEEALRRQQSAAADRAEAIALNQYKAGLIAYTDVVTQQTAALNARLTLVNITSSRQAAAVALVQALGGGWSPPIH